MSRAVKDCCLQRALRNHSDGEKLQKVGYLHFWLSDTTTRIQVHISIVNLILLLGEGSSEHVAQRDGLLDCHILMWYCCMVKFCFFVKQNINKPEGSFS